MSAKVTARSWWGTFSIKTNWELTCLACLAKWWAAELPCLLTWVMFNLIYIYHKALYKSFSCRNPDCSGNKAHSTYIHASLQVTGKETNAHKIFYSSFTLHHNNIITFWHNVNTKIEQGIIGPFLKININFSLYCVICYKSLLHISSL